jgi:hypothetical protein
MNNTVIRVEPIGPLLHLAQLVDACVQAEVFDDPMYRHERYVGVIDEVKINCAGTFVHFIAPDLVGAKWIRLNRVIGFAWFEADTQKAAV